MLMALPSLKGGKVGPRGAAVCEGTAGALAPPCTWRVRKVPEPRGRAGPHMEGALPGSRSTPGQHQPLLCLLCSLTQFLSGF